MFSPKRVSNLGRLTVADSSSQDKICIVSILLLIGYCKPKGGVQESRMRSAGAAATPRNNHLATPHPSKALKVHKIENFFGFDFEFYTVSLLVMLKYEGFVTKNL